MPLEKTWSVPNLCVHLSPLFMIRTHGKSGIRTQLVPPLLDPVFPTKGLNPLSSLEAHPPEHCPAPNPQATQLSLKASFYPPKVPAKNFFEPFPDDIHYLSGSDPAN